MPFNFGSNDKTIFSRFAASVPRPSDCSFFPERFLLDWRRSGFFSFTALFCFRVNVFEKIRGTIQGLNLSSFTPYGQP
jgi:hypothetical protein